MVNTIIEDDLKAVFDADTWTVVPDGVTKQTFVWAESTSRSNRLENPGNFNHTANNIIIVIHPSARSTTGVTSGSDSYSYLGELKIYGNTYADIDAAFDKIKALDDANQYLEIHLPGINGNPIIGKYWSNALYQWKRNLSH